MLNQARIGIPDSIWIEAERTCGLAEFCLLDIPLRTTNPVPSKLCIRAANAFLPHPINRGFDEGGESRFCFTTRHDLRRRHPEPHARILIDPLIAECFEYRPVIAEPNIG
ncbi:MAG: hypothetical protein M5U07_01360 [Xanthobacteraceae bacterium]|nr:hypothetical protein [Xanthobacteraceae bacterium]